MSYFDPSGEGNEPFDMPQWTEPCVSPIVTALVDRLATEGDFEAVSDAAAALSIGELVDGASRLAARLTDSPSEQPAVVLVDRSVASVQAILGVQWAARPLLTLDVDEPTSRLRDVIHQLGAASVVDATGRGPTELAGQRVIRTAELAATYVEPLAGRPDAIGSMLFTSGSTGQPKVVVRRRWQEFEAARRDLVARPVPHGERAAVFAPLHWLFGHALVRQISFGQSCSLVDPTSLSPDDLADEIEARDITAMSMTPSLLQVLSSGLTGGRRLDRIRSPLFYVFIRL